MKKGDIVKVKSSSMFSAGKVGTIYQIHPGDQVDVLFKETSSMAILNKSDLEFIAELKIGDTVIVERSDKYSTLSMASAVGKKGVVRSINLDYLTAVLDFTEGDFHSGLCWLLTSLSKVDADIQETKKIRRKL
jgi:hypothetical protein